MADEPDVDMGHPRGTLLVVGVFGLLFGAAWFALFLIRFLGTGAPHH